MKLKSEENGRGATRDAAGQTPIRAGIRQVDGNKKGL